MYREKESAFPFLFHRRFRRVEPLEAPKGYMTRGMVWTRPHLNPNGDDFRRRGCRWNGRPRGGTKKASRGRQRGERFTLFSDVTTMPAICHWQIFPLVFPESANYRPEAHVFPFLYCIGFTSNLTLHPAICSFLFFFLPSFRLWRYDFKNRDDDYSNFIDTLFKQLKIKQIFITLKEYSIRILDLLKLMNSKIN